MKHLLSILILFNFMSVASAVTFGTPELEGDKKYYLYMCIENYEDPDDERYSYEFRDIYAFEPSVLSFGDVNVFSYERDDKGKLVLRSEGFSKYNSLEDYRYITFNYDYNHSYVNDDLELVKEFILYSIVLDTKLLEYRSSYTLDGERISYKGSCQLHPELKPLSIDPINYFK